MLRKSLEEKIARWEAGTANIHYYRTPPDPHTSASTVMTPAATAVSTSVMIASSMPVISTSPSTATVSSTATLTSVRSSVTGTSTTVSTPVIPSIGSVEMMVKLFETQSQLIAAQVKDATLLPLAGFNEQSDRDKLEFERWLERFEDRARLAKWTEETKLCQLKLHLSKVADQAFQMLFKDVKSSYERVVDTLKERFGSVEMKEWKSMEFHRRVQSDETILELGMDLQKLTRRAFPLMADKELDRMFSIRLCTPVGSGS